MVVRPFEFCKFNIYFNIQNKNILSFRIKKRHRVSMTFFDFQ